MGGRDGNAQAGGAGRWLEAANVPRGIHLVVSAKLATLSELNTVYGLEDLHDLLECMSVDGINEHRAAMYAAAKREQAMAEAKATAGRR